MPNGGFDRACTTSTAKPTIATNWFPPHGPLRDRASMITTCGREDSDGGLEREVGFTLLLRGELELESSGPRATRRRAGVPYACFFLRAFLALPASAGVSAPSAAA